MKSIFITLGLLATMIVPAAAQNLVADGGFENPITGVEFKNFYNLNQQNTCKIGDWTLNGTGNDGDGWGAQAAIFESATPDWGLMYNPEGNQLLWLRSYPYLSERSFPTIQQTLATVAGQQYTVKFALGNYRYGDGLGQVKVTLGNLSEIFTANPVGAEDGGWQYFERTITASGNDVLQIQRFANESLIDDVSVTAAAVPEPSSLIALFSGLIGVGGLIRRKK